MGKKVIIMFRREFELSSASKNRITTFSRPFVHYACLRLCSAIVHFIRKNFLYFVSESCNGYITNFCNIIESLHELKTVFF